VVNILLSRLDDLVSDRLLHQVHLALPNDLHQLVLKWNYELLASLTFS
jgi:hypothetical protein